MKTLYYNGPVYTMESPEPVQALLVENGRVVAAGNREELEARRPQGRVNLDGRALLPAFIDAHSHFSAVANALLQAPLDEAASFQEIQERLADFIRQGQVPPGQWVIAKGYDQNQLAERAHPTLALLDAAAPYNPLVAQHKSGHMAVFNSRALEALGVTAGTPDPPGGRIGREGGRLTGYMEENASLSYLRQVPMPGMEDLLAAYQKAQAIYASHGIVTVQEGMLVAELIPLYQGLLKSGLLKLDVAAYADFNAWEALRAAFPGHLRGHAGNFRLAGRKIFLDGSPQGRTAWMTRPYLNGEPGYRGYPTMTDGAVYQALCQSAQEGIQLLAHCNGDAAAAQFLHAAELAAQAYPALTRQRHVIVHAQLLRPGQLPAVKALGLIPSFFVAHVYHWGDVHLQNFGLERAAHISPAGAARRAGAPFTFHQDAPVIQPDMLETVWCAACRKTKAGAVLGPDEAIPVYDALRAVTYWAAYQYFEEGEKGSLAPGKRADLVLLDQDPLSVPLDGLRRICVLETIKAGEPLWP